MRKAVIGAVSAASLLWLGALGTVAQSVIGSFAYFRSADPMTDADRSRIVTGALNATLSRDGRLSFECRDDGLNVVLFADEYLASSGQVSVQHRFDQNPASPLQGWEVSTDNTSAFIPLYQVGNFTAGALRSSQVVVRAYDYNGTSYTYTFNLGSLGDALGGLSCARGYGVSTGNSGSPAPAPAPSSGSASGAPKFTNWTFTRCTSLAGAVTTFLPLGKEAACELVVNVVPNGARPVSAIFSYSLDYTEARGGKVVPGTLNIAEKDVWTAGSSKPIALTNRGTQYVFKLPLLVRKRESRRYTAINVTGKIVFSNGAVKTVYEPLVVR